MDTAKDKIKALFDMKGILLAYLFGSQVDAGKGFYKEEKTAINPSSDLDIAVLFKEPPSSIYRVYGELYKELCDIFQPFNIDLVFMHEVNYLFKFDIICGFCIHSSDEKFREEYEEKVAKFASDISFKRKMFESDFHEAIRDGHFEIKL